VLHVKAISTSLCRVLLIAFCGFAAWRSIRIAIADWVASAGTLPALERATRFAPDDARLLARVAISRSDSGDQSPATDKDLRRAAQINPLDSSLLMTLGLRQEFRGNGAEAEDYLVRAAEIDHQFKPAWTLANYYYRNNQPDKGWPMIERILNLEPLGFDPRAVFDLCWRQTADTRKILGLIPKRGHRSIQYLAFLIGTKRTDAALDVWPEALAAADPADLYDIGTLTGFVDFMAGADRVREAVTVWNQLVDRGLIHAGRLDPAKGASIADPEFQVTPAGKAFDWHVAEIPGVSVGGFSGSLRFEINGDEPQSFEVLSAFAPVLSATRYRLVWKSDGSLLKSPQDPGFGFQIVQRPGDPVVPCPPLLSAGDTSHCDFVTPAAGKPGDMNRARIVLSYLRASGTTRVSGTLQLFDVHLELAQ
jgi:tetratricopeptide (TPR) repeat protein